MERYQALMGTIPVVVRAQLDHLEPRLREHCLHDDFCQGYVLGAIFFLLKQMDLPTVGLGAQGICLNVFSTLYAQDGMEQLAHAIEQVHTAAKRFAAGMLAGGSDMAEALFLGAPATRLRAEFSLTDQALDAPHD